MTQVKNWSDEQVNGVFDALKLNNQNEPMKISPDFRFASPIPLKKIYLPKLSDNSMPPPTGRLMNANLENSNK